MTKKFEINILFQLKMNGNVIVEYKPYIKVNNDIINCMFDYTLTINEILYIDIDKERLYASQNLGPPQVMAHIIIRAIPYSETGHKIVKKLRGLDHDNYTNRAAIEWQNNYSDILKWKI